MNRQPVTLRRHDSINLTTGVVTRSDVATAKITEYPGHRPGMLRNDLVTFHSLIVCNALRGHIGLDCTTTNGGAPYVLTPDHRSCQHSSAPVASGVIFADCYDAGCPGCADGH